MMKQRDLILVPFPFSNQSGRKVRPVIVISNDNFNLNSDDILVVGVTSNISKDKYTLDLTNDNLEEGKLFAKCCIKVENIFRIDKVLAIKKIGKLKIDNLKRIVGVILKIIGN